MDTDSGLFYQRNVIVYSLTDRKGREEKEKKKFTTH